MDGELDEPVWHAAAATTPFVHDGIKRVVPHTEARAAWDADALYLVFYVGDAELRGDDQVAVTFDGVGAVEVHPQGTVTCRLGALGDCARAGVVARVERDGDVDADQEEDEEWAVELKLPWAVVAPGGRPALLPVNFSRLETRGGGGERIREVWSRGCGALRLE